MWPKGFGRQHSCTARAIHAMLGMYCGLDRDRGLFADMLRQHFAAAMKSALADFCPKCIHGGDGFVVLNRGIVRSDVDGDGLRARHPLELALHPTRIENGQHATDFENGCVHARFLSPRSALLLTDLAPRCEAWKAITSFRRRHRSSYRQPSPAPKVDVVFNVSAAMVLLLLKLQHASSRATGLCFNI